MLLCSIFHQMRSDKSVEPNKTPRDQRPSNSQAAETCLAQSIRQSEREMDEFRSRQKRRMAFRQTTSQR